ncbi:CD209 antigen-like protein A [Salminus brasiliensis]|uniref:CD209 antigen-like protein A n=1 Tax=Salminus brasiliensis TaxID=930266 RepID=UPI003B82F871
MIKPKAHIQNFGEKHDCLLPEHNDDLKNYSWILSENKDNMKLQEEVNKLIKEKDERIKQLQTKNDELCTNLKARNLDEVCCAKSWTYFRGKCYYVSTDWKTWTASRHACRAKGGDLLIIESEEEKDFIKTLGTYNEYYWIGLTKAVKEGDWRWLDGTKLNTSMMTGVGTVV